MDLATILGKHNQNWQVLVFLTLLCIVLGFVAKLCRESRCFGVKFYVANHAVLVPHFDAQKGIRATKQLFRRSDRVFRVSSAAMLRYCSSNETRPAECRCFVSCYPPLQDSSRAITVM